MVAIRSKKGNVVRQVMEIIDPPGVIQKDALTHEIEKRPLKVEVNK